MITAYPKIFQLGTDYIRDIFNGEVEITEKLDGSQFAFAKVNGTLYFRSKGAMIFPGAEPAMFKPVVKHILSVQDRLLDGLVYYGETLQKPKHNTISYERIPKNHLALFGIQAIERQIMVMYETIKHWAETLDVDVVPMFDYGKVRDMNTLKELLQIDSYLGGSKVEGVVVKNYNQPFLLGGQPIPIMAGKLVREEFKELNRSTWSNEKGKFQIFLDSMKSEARWKKAIQHLAEKNELSWEPKDIGKLVKEINTDLEFEEVDEIKQFLWKHFKGDIMRAATRGFPEWYKMKLTERSFD